MIYGLPPFVLSPLLLRSAPSPHSATSSLPPSSPTLNLHQPQAPGPPARQPGRRPPPSTSSVARRYITVPPKATPHGSLLGPWTRLRIPAVSVRRTTSFEVRICRQRLHFRRPFRATSARQSARHLRPFFSVDPKKMSSVSFRRRVTGGGGGGDDDEGFSSSSSFQTSKSSSSNYQVYRGMSPTTSNRIEV